MRPLVIVLISVISGGCAPLPPPSSSSAPGDRARRVEALLNLRERNHPDAAETEAALLDDPDVVVRWTAARSLAARPAKDTCEAVLRRLPGLSKPGIWLGLEVLRRAAADVEPTRLAFLADLKPMPGSELEEGRAHADEMWNGRLRIQAARVLMNSSRSREAFGTLAKLAPGPWVAEVAEIAAASRRPAAVDYIHEVYRTAHPFDEFTSRLAIRCLDEPSIPMWTIALGRVKEDILADGLRRVSSPAVIEEAFASLERREVPQGLRARLVDSLINNNIILPARMARFLDREDDPAVLDAAFVIFRDTEFLNLEPPLPAGRDPSCYLDVRHESIRQMAAASILLHRTEPHRKRAERLLREAPEILLSADVVAKVHSIEPLLGETLIWRILRSPKVDVYAIETLVPRLLGSGRRELVELVLKTDAEEVPKSVRTLSILAHMPRPEDRPALRLALEGDDPGCRFFAGTALVRLGDPEGLQPFLCNLSEVSRRDWPLSFSAFRADSEKDPRDAAQWALGILRERFSREAVAAASTEAWGKAPSSELLRLSGELRDPALKPILIGSLNDETYGPDAARFLGELPGEDTARALHKALEGKNELTRRSALQSLVLLEDPDLADHLVKVLRRTSDNSFCPAFDKNYAAEVLYNLGTEEAIRALIAAGETESAAGLHNVAEKLAVLAPERPETAAVVGHLIRNTWHESLIPDWLTPYLRAHPGLRPDVLQATRSPEPAIRARAADLLSLFPHPGSEEALVRLLDDADKRVREAAFMSLEELGSPAGLEKARALMGRGWEEQAFELFDYLAEAAPSDLLPAALKEADGAEPSARSLALRCLYRIRSPGAIEGILRHMAHFSERYCGGGFGSGSHLHGYIEGWKTLSEWEEWWADHWRSPPFTVRWVKNWTEDREDPPFAHVAYQPFRGVRQWRGSADRDFDGPQEFAVGDAAAWKALWRRFRMPAPPADFGAHTALVALFSDPSFLASWDNNYGPKILGLTRDESRIRVYVARYHMKVKSPVSVGRGGKAWHVVLVPRIEGRIEFVTTDAWMERD